MGVVVAVVEDIDNGLKSIKGREIIVECLRSVSAGEKGVVVWVVTASFTKVVVRGGITAAEFVVISSNVEGELMRKVVLVLGVVVLKHEIANGFTCDFATLHHQIEVQHIHLALRYPFTEKEISNSNQIPNLFRYHWNITLHFLFSNFELNWTWILLVFFFFFLKEGEREGN